MPELLRRLERYDDRERLENNFSAFLEEAWHTVDSAPYQKFWGIDAICDHLEAVTLGSIKRLLINVPPRTSKTKSASVSWNAWLWARSQRSFLSGPQVKFLSASYNERLSLMASTWTRRMLFSPWYQERWGNRFALRLDQQAKSNFENTEGGARISTSVRGSLLGLGGDIIVIDDPNYAETEKKIESDADRRLVASWWQEISSTRLNDPKRTAIVVVQQRLHQHDLSGIITEAMENDEEDWCHLVIPMEFEDRRRYWTVVLPQYISSDGEEPSPWTDPRAEVAKETRQYGQLMWPERFGPKEVKAIRDRLGPFLYAGRYQQIPVPKGGGIIKQDWWQVWNQAIARRYDLEWNEHLKQFPRTDLVVASIDTAMKEKEENDFSAMTVWGIFKDLNKNTRAMLMYGWQKRLEFMGPTLTKRKWVDKATGKQMAESDVQLRERQKRAWGLVETIADTCRRYKVNLILIEDKTRGHDVAKELRRQNAREKWQITMVDPAGDKTSRMHSVVPLFANGGIYAPITQWADEVIKNVSLFPKGEHDDLSDTCSQFLIWARDNDILMMSEEATAALEDEMLYQGPQSDTIASHYGVG